MKNINFCTTKIEKKLDGYCNNDIIEMITDSIIIEDFICQSSIK